MIKVTRRMNKIKSNFLNKKSYDVFNALNKLKELSYTKFIESVDVAINLDINNKKNNQAIQGCVLLPYGINRKIRIAAFVQGNDIELAKSAGADIIGVDNLSDQIKKGIIDFDLIIATQNTMNDISKLGHILGPKGLMPNVKIGTVTNDIYKSIKHAKFGQIRYKSDKYGIIHASIGKINLENDKLQKNLDSLIESIKSNKPLKIKGNYIKKITLTTTMGISIKINYNNL